MKLELIPCLKPKLSERVKEMIDKIMNTTDDLELADYLFNCKIQDDIEQIDIPAWIPVIAKIDDILSTMAKSVPSLQNKQNPTTLETSTKRIVCGLLTFLYKLLQTKFEKRYFQSFSVFEILLQAYDIEIVDLSLSVLYQASTPSASILSSIEGEGVEVPSSLSQLVCDIFMATGLYCPDYGLMDYLRGHLPVDSDAELKFSFPQKSEEPTQPESKVDKTGIVFLAADSVGLVPKEQIVRLSTESHLNDLLPNDVDSTACVVNYKAEEALKALYQQYPQSQANPVAALFLLRTVDGLKGSLDARLRLVQLRLKSLYILVNSRATDPQYQTVLKSNGLFVRDLLALSDISSEGAHDIKQYDASLAVSTLALDCVVNILKCVHRRKGPLIKIGIERHLGIVLRNNDPNADLHTFEHIGGFHETLWVSILLSACASVDAHFTDVIMNSQLKPVILMTPTNRYVAVDRSRICSASYLRSALELFGTVLNMYDQFEFSGEGSLVGAMATVLQHSAGYCKCLLAQLRVSIDANDYASVDTTLYDNEEYFWAIAKGLACLIVSFGRQGFLSSMMECDLLTFFSNLLEAFSDSSILSSKLVGTSLKNIPDKVLHLLSQYVAHGGRRAVPTGGDSGIQVLQQVFFGSLCSQALLCPVSQLWSRIFLVTRSAISAEPTYLAQYIKSPHAEALKLALINKNFSSDSLFNENIDKFLPNLAKLLHSLCITADGQTFLRDSNAVPFIVDCLVNPDLLMPNSAGLTVETLKVCANQISYIMRDCAPLRLSIRVSLQNLILKVCREVYDHAKTSANGDGESDERSQALQKLFNLCSFIENMGTDGRRQSADIFREIFSEDILAALLRTYPCTLPPPRRLFAQLSVRNVPGHSPIYGHFPSSKALNNVIKIVASVNAQSLIQVLFRNIDEILANISSFKTELCTMTSSTSSLASLSEDSDAHVYSEPVKSNRKHKKRDLAADSDQVSLGGIKKAVAGTVHILGVLDRVPHMCAFDPRLTSGSASISDAEETAIWNFLVATLSFEWSLTQLSYVIRFTQKNQGQNQNIITVAHKDYIRRIFAFHRSALLEVCRFAATKQSPKPLSNCRNARGLRESFCSFDSSETDVVTPRVPSAYKLRVINNDGVLFRETCEMEGSRVVLLAGLGTICTAYERKVISARLPQGGFTSVVRYRTAHGWISEHRRDHHSLLEVLDILPPVGDNEKEDVKPDPVAEALTLREASSYVLSRTLISLRSIGTYLSRAILNQENMRARDGERSFSQSAPMLASSLGKVSKSYFTYALQKIDENSARPQSLVLFEPSSDVGSFESLSPTKQSASSQQPKTTTKLGRGKSRSMSFEEFDRDNYEEKTNVSISPGAFCLYFGAVIKYFMLPIMDDRNEHLNTYLFRYIHHYNVMDSIISAMLFGLATLHDAVSVAKLSNTVLSATSGPFKAISDFDLNSSGRCALMSLPSCLYIVRKLSQTDTYIKSNITETLVNMMTFPSDDLGPFQLQDMVYDCICTIGKRLLPLFESKIISSSDFPPDIQQFWLSIVSNLIKSFRASLPAFSVSKLVAESKRPESRRYIFDRQRSIETNNVVAARSEINRVDVSVPQLSPGVAVDINSEVAAAETIVHMSSQDESVSTLQPSIPDVESIILQPLSPSVLNVDQESSSTATASENPVDSGPYVATSESASLENTQPSLLEQFMDPDELAALGDDPELLAALQMSLGQSVSLESFASPSVVDASSAPLLPSVLSVSTEGGDVLVTPSHASVVVKKADKSMSFSTPTKEFVPADPTTERVTALKDLSSKYSNSIEENLRLSSCTSDLLHSWEGKSVGTMAPALVTFIVESDKSSYLTTSGGDLGSSWSLFSNLLDYLRSLSDQDSIPFPSLFGAFHLALCLLYEKETCDRIFNKLVETNATMKKFFDIFCNLLRKYGAAFSNLPDNVDTKLVAIQSSWISPAFLFLHKVLTLAKESNGDEESTRLSIDSDTIRETVSTTIGHLKLCSSSAVPLETQLLHSIVLFLETAMTDQDVIDEFVFEGGLSYLLGMVKVSSPSNSIDEKISATESQKLLSKILIKCLETEHELMYLAIYNIRHFFRKTNSNRVTMSDFLTHFASSITRSPTGFGSVAGALFKTVHRGEPNQSSVYLELFDKQTQDHNLKNILKLSPSLDRPYDSNDRAQNTAKLFISVLLNHSESEKMLSKADSINCLSDAALALPRASTIFSKVEVPTMIHSSSSLVQWITHTYISIGVPKSTDPSISVASSAVIARSVFRFFLILCSRRGPCRSQVLKSIIQTAHDSIALLSDTSVSVPTSQKQNDENVSKLCRLSSLISSAIRLSTDHAPQRHTPANQQNFTLDAVSQLVQSDVPEKLVLALDEIIRKSPQSSENAITSLLDPIELFTRPSIQEYVKRAVLEEFKLPSADDPHELGHASDDFAGSTSGVNHEPLVGLQTDDGTNVSFGILGGNIQEPGDIAADGNDNNNDDDGVEEGDDHPHDEDDNHDGDDDEDDDAEADEEDDEEEDGDESGGDEDEDVEGEEDEGEDEVDEMELEDDEGDDPYDPVENGLENRLETEILRLENALRAQNAAGGTDESWELLNATDGSRAAGSNTTPDARNQFISHMREGLLLDINDDGDGSERAGVDHDILRFLNRHGSNEALAAVQRLRAGVPILEGPPGGQVPYIHPLVRRPGDVLAVRPAIDRDDQELRLHDLPFPGRASMFAGMEGVENDDFPMLRPFVPSTGRHLPTGLNNRNGNNRPSTNANSRRSGARAVPSAVLQLELQLIASSVSEPVIEPTPVVPLPMPSTTTLPSSTNAAELSMEDAQAVVSELTIMLRETSIHAEESIHLLDQVDEVLSPIASLENIPAPTSEIPLESNISTLISESIIPTESIAPDGVDAVSEVFEEDPVPSDIEAVVVEIETAIATPSEIVDSESVSILTSSGIGSSLQTSSINGGEVLPETAAAAVAESNAENNGESEPSTANAPARLYNCPEGYEEEVFYSLPDFMQRELSEQQNEASQQVRELAESAGFDYETLMSLPESIRQEILDQARRDLEATTRGASSDGSAGATGAATDPDNASFLQSLTPELRAEVLLTAEPDFLATLPPELIAEAQMHRDQAAANWQRREMSNRHQAQQATGDEGEEEDEEGGVSIRPRNAQSTDSVFSVKGFMKVPVEKNDLVVFSSRVVLLITKLLSSSEHSQSKAKLLIPIVQNLSQYKVFRELILGLLTGALHNSKELANLVERADSCKRSSNLSTSDNLEGIEAFIKSATPLKRFRMLVQLKHILSNTSVLYDLLKPSTVEESCTSEGLGDSSNSLIETIVESLSLPFLQQSSSDILAFLTTLEIITKPLDHFVPIPDATSTIPTDGSLVKIPDVLFSKVNFHRICDILSWDVCTKNIAELVIKITVRLSNNPKNAIILTQEIVEVLSDLFGESEARLAALQINLDEIMLTIPAGQNSKKTLVSYASKLPIGSCGARQYERLLRCVQTLHLVSSKQGRTLIEVAPSESFDRLWSSLERVLSLLRAFLAEDSEKDSLDSKRPQSSLTSLLGRILPAIESFFLYHTFDILDNTAEKKKEANVVSAGSSSQPVASESVVTTAVDGETPSVVADPPESVVSIRKQSQITMPGEKYRQTERYRNLNIFLQLNEGKADEKLPGDASIRKTLSLRYVQSSGFSIHGAASSQLPRYQCLISFCHAHKGLLNLLVKSQPHLLDDSLAAFVKVVNLRACLSFENKRKYFFLNLRKLRRESSRMIGLSINLRRNKLFEDSFQQMQGKSGVELQGRLRITFQGEEGIDAGGLTREWFSVISKEIFNPNYALFTATADGLTFQPNPLSNINSNHLDYFKFVGRVIGKAICDGHLMDAHFTRTFYKHTLGMHCDYHDIEAVEPDYYKSLKQILEFPLDMLGVELSFSAEIHTFGKIKTVDLIPNGRNIAVTDENKSEYIRLIVHHRTTSGIKSQIEAFLGGFYELVPPELISIFSPTELELLICGLPDVDVDELEANTDYHQFKKSDESIVWFWDALRSFTREEKALFLQFVTGTSKVPLEGFSNLQGMRGSQRFSIHRAGSNAGFLPTAHTCFNQLDLPVYRSQEELREKLLVAIKEGAEGFGFA